MSDAETSNPSGASETSEPAVERIRLRDISSRAWEHPADAAALQALRRVPGVDLVLRKVFGLFSERALYLITAGSAVEVGPRQYPALHASYSEVLEILDAPMHYPLFVAQTPAVKSGAVGMERPFIVMNVSAVAALDEDQRRVWLAREVSHILSEHVLYKTLLRLMMRAGFYTFSMPLTGIAFLGVLAAFLEWDRKSELSADRASLLVAQDPAHVRQALLRMAGGGAEGANLEAFQEQSERCEESTAFDSVIRTLALLNRDHPFPVQRLRELERWIEAGHYERALRGDYPLRQDDPQREDWVRAYAEGVKVTADPAVSWLKDVGNAAADQATNVFGRLRRKLDE